MTLAEIGEAIRLEREARGLSQADVGQAVHTTQQTIDRIEKNLVGFSRYRRPTLLFLGLQHLADAADEPEARFLDTDKLGTTEFFRTPSSIPLFSIVKTDESTNIIAPGQIGVTQVPLGLASIKRAYAAIVTDWDMAPAFEPRNIILMNPSAPILANDDVLFSRKTAQGWQVMIARVEAVAGFEGSSHFTVRRWSKPAPERLDATVWTRQDLIVGKFTNVW